MLLTFLLQINISLFQFCETAKLPTYDKSNCVQSLFFVLQQKTKISFTIKDKQEIFIMYKQPLTINQKKGVVYNLVTRNYATEIKLQFAKKGDIVQFWNDSWGHCGVYSHIANNKIYLYSSFPGSNWSLTFFDLPKCIYVCRIHTKYIK